MDLGGGSEGRGPRSMPNRTPADYADRFSPTVWMLFELMAEGFCVSLSSD